MSLPAKPRSEIRGHRSLRFGGWSLAGLLLMIAGLHLGGCDASSDRAILPADLYGSWVGETISGRALFFFQLDEQVQRFELRAALGEFTDSLNSGDVILSKGRWGVNGTTLNLVDEAALLYICLATDGDPYDVTLNQDKTIMLLDYLGQKCPIRGDLLASADWIKQDDGPEKTLWR